MKSNRIPIKMAHNSSVFKMDKDKQAYLEIEVELEIKPEKIAKMKPHELCQLQEMIQARTEAKHEQLKKHKKKKKKVSLHTPPAFLSRAQAEGRVV